MTLVRGSLFNLKTGNQIDISTISGLSVASGIENNIITITDFVDLNKKETKEKKYVFNELEQDFELFEEENQEIDKIRYLELSKNKENKLIFSNRSEYIQLEDNFSFSENTNDLSFSKIDDCWVFVGLAFTEKEEKYHNDHASSKICDRTFSVPGDGPTDLSKDENFYLFGQPDWEGYVLKLLDNTNKRLIFLTGEGGGTYSYYVNDQYLIISDYDLGDYQDYYTLKFVQRKAPYKSELFVLQKFSISDIYELNANQVLLRVNLDKSDPSNIETYIPFKNRSLELDHFVVVGISKILKSN